METAAAVEIDKGGLRRLFLDDFHRCLKKPAQKTTPAFSQFPTGPTTIKLTVGDWIQKDALLRRATQTQETSLTQKSGHRPRGGCQESPGEDFDFLRFIMQS